ncbi:CU044_5270 family protein [Streptomyces sp. NPDC046853]|uniref:CU044_5270 family protein n=1 Tax=Streptomyces sp. NPDC046853 TaxID=3154920 RepID=UPI0033EB9CBE
MTERSDLLDFPGADELISAGAVVPPAPEVVAAAQTAVASAARRDTAVVPLRTRTVPRRRRLLVAAAAVAAIAAGAVAYPVLDLGGTPAATASAAQFLDDMADVAADAPAARSPYWKVRMETVNQDDGNATTTTYFDRAGRIWTVDANGTVHGPGKGSKTKKWPVGKKWLTWPALDKLPTGQKALTALFPRDAESRRHQVTALLEDSPASPGLRAALFRVLADTSGVKLIGDVKDSKGRQGVAFEIRWSTIGFSTGPGKDVKYRMTDRYIVDPDTGLLLETTHKNHGKGGSSDRYTWLEVGPAERVG